MKTKNSAALPTGYEEARAIDLQKNTKLALVVNIGAFAIVLALVVTGIFAVPFDLFDAEGLTTGVYLTRLGVAVGGILVYIVLHEAVHGLFMVLFGCGVKPTFGFTGLYAFAASRAYFNKVSYLIIGLSPVVLWGIVLLLLNLFLPTVWFWPVYVIQIMNLSGAAGDLYVTCLLLRAPKTLLVQDDGVAMRFYLPASSEN